MALELLAVDLELALLDSTWTLEGLEGDLLDLRPLIPLMSGAVLTSAVVGLDDGKKVLALAKPMGEEVSLFLLDLPGLLLVIEGLKDLLVGDVDAVFLELEVKVDALVNLDGDVAEVMLANLCLTTF